jgi:type IV pilus assembly protein PilV
MFTLRHNQGFTIVEVLIALSVLTIGLLGVAGLTMMIIYGNSFSRTLTTATALAYDKLEELRDTPYEKIADGKKTLVERNITYIRVWRVTADQPAAGMKTVEVTVSWATLKQRQPVVLKTIIAPMP